MSFKKVATFTLASIGAVTVSALTYTYAKTLKEYLDGRKFEKEWIERSGEYTSNGKYVELHRGLE